MTGSTTEQSLTLRDTERFRSAMNEAGLDTVRLAKAAGVSKQYVSLLLHGRRRCRQGTAVALLQALNVPRTDLPLFFAPVLSEITNNGQMEQPDHEEPPMTITATHTAVHEHDPLLTFEEVAEMARLPIGTLRHYRATGKGPEFFRLGGRLKIRESKARAWLAQFENPGTDA